MNKREFELLALAGVIEKCVISGSANPISQSTDWFVWFYGEGVRDNSLRTARGDLRVFSTLDTAYRFIRAAGFNGKVYVENI